MTADDQQSLGWRRKRRSYRLKEALGGMPGVSRAPGPIHEETGASAVGKEDRWLTMGIGGHGTASDFRGRVCRPEVICLNNYPMHEEAAGIQEVACAFAAGGKRMPKSVPDGRVGSVRGRPVIDERFAGAC